MKQREHHGGEDKAKSPAERRFAEGVMRLMPNYRLALSYLGKTRRSTASSTERTVSTSAGKPSASRSDITE